MRPLHFCRGAIHGALVKHRPRLLIKKRFALAPGAQPA